MTAIDTRQFMALMTIATHYGRPDTPTDKVRPNTSLVMSIAMSQRSPSH